MTFSLFMALIITVGLSGIVFGQRIPAATLISIKGKAYIKNAGSEPGKGVLLTGSNKPLYPGQVILCAADCRELVLDRCGVKRPLTRSPKWRTVLAINCASSDRPRRGNERTYNSAILSPYDGETLRPESFAVKWDSDLMTTTVDLSIRINGVYGEEIWNEKRLPARRGAFTSPALITELLRLQRKGHDGLVLFLKDSKTESFDWGEVSKVNFKLLTARDNNELAANLAELQMEPDALIRTISVAIALSNAELFAESVKEIEKALDLARQGPYAKDNLFAVKKLAILINYHAYNDERADLLCRTLTRLERRPFPCTNSN